MSSGVGMISGSSAAGCVAVALLTAALAGGCAFFFHAQAKCLFRYVLSTAASNCTQSCQKSSLGTELFTYTVSLAIMLQTVSEIPLGFLLDRSFKVLQCRFGLTSRYSRVKRILIRYS